MLSPSQPAPLRLGMMTDAFTRFSPCLVYTSAASGNFAAALALAGYRTGHPVVLCLPATAPLARQKQLSALGAKLALCNYVYGRAGCEKRAVEIAAERGGYFMNHYANDLNPEYHLSLIHIYQPHRAVHALGVGRLADLAGAGRHAFADVIVEAGPLLAEIPRKLLAAAVQLERILRRGHHLPHRKAAHIGADPPVSYTHLVCELMTQGNFRFMTLPVRNVM